MFINGAQHMMVHELRVAFAYLLLLPSASLAQWHTDQELRGGKAFDEQMKTVRGLDAPALVTHQKGRDAPALVAQQKGREVRIFTLSSTVRVTGDTTPASDLFYILFTKESCPLDIEGAAGMRRAWQNTAQYQLGCWYPTRDDTWVFVGQDSSMDTNVRMYWEAYPRALLHADGSATITEPSYDAGFQNKIIVKHLAEAHARLYSGVKDKP
jgi:hypothetical protein